MEERTQIIRSLDHMGSAGKRLRGEVIMAGGAEVCAAQAKAMKSDKPAAKGTEIEDENNLERNNGKVEYWNRGRRCLREGRASARPRHADACLSPSCDLSLPIIPTFPYSNIPVEVNAIRLLVKKLNLVLWHNC